MGLSDAPDAIDLPKLASLVTTDANRRSSQSLAFVRSFTFESGSEEQS